MPRKADAPNRTHPATVRADIQRALAANAISQAARLAEAALAHGQIEPIILNLAAWQREEAGDYAGAHRLLRQALDLAPRDPLVMAAIGAVLRKEGRFEEALAVLDEALALAPGHAAGWLERGFVFDGLRNWARSRASYERALDLDPTMAPAAAKLADLAAKDGDAEAGRRLAMRAVAIDPHNAAAACAIATMDIEAGDGASAEAGLKALLRCGCAGDDRTRALTLLGDALDRQDRTAEAFNAWRRAQRNFREIYRRDLSPQKNRPSHRAFIDAIAAQVRSAPAMVPVPPDDPIAGAAERHVFLLGYPRSGTTLVENILASAPGVTALEERDTLDDADRALLANDGTMPLLDALDPALVADLRAAYWQRVAALGGGRGETFVDMNPFNGLKLPVIARLFPQARILVMRRDPRDVVLSCYRVNFTPSTAAWAFSDLKEAARHYDSLMQLTELCRERLPLAFHEVRYDRLVSDFAPTVRALAEFVGLPWTDDFRRFDRTAKARGVRTASATQVRRGLYDGRGQWRRYSRELEPALPILAPWVGRYGFEP